MLLRVLGPVEVEMDGRWLPPGPPKQRAVLATLALNAGRSVSVRSLAQVLWAERPPTSAVRNIQMYVWRLRQFVGQRIQSRPAGYLLEVESGELDADRFAELVQRGRAARADGDLTAAGSHIAAALAVWQGSALSDLTATGMALELARPLEEKRRQAIGELVDVELALGRGEDLVPRLAAWVQAYPSDEALRERQIRLLLDLGRPAEALAMYDAAESSLRTELDTWPGPTLRRLAGAARRALPKTASLRLLPPTASTFVGRRAEMTNLADLLAPRVISVPVVAISGPGGIGKSSLALRVAHQLVDLFADGQLYLDLSGSRLGVEPMRSNEAVRSLLIALGTRADEVSANPGDAAALYRARVSGQNLLLVLDNVADAEQIRSLLPGTAGCAVLATARAPLTGLDEVTQVSLGTLPPEDAHELVTALVGADRLATEGPDALTMLVEACGGLPLALKVAGARLASRPSWSVRGLGQRLLDERYRLNELCLGDVAVRTTFEVSYRHLSERAQLVFRSCGLFPGPDFAAEPIAVLSGLDVAEVGIHLESLVDAALLQSDRPMRFHPHDLIRIYAAELADATDGGFRTSHALQRLAAWYLAAADAADRLLAPPRHRTAIAALDSTPELGFRDRSEALAWLEEERHTLLALVRLAAQRGWHTIAAQLPSVLKVFLDLNRYTDDWITCHQVGLAAARQLGDLTMQARALNGLGSGYWRQDRYTEAIDCYRQALDLVRELGDRVKEAVLLNNLGGVYGDCGDHDTAITYLCQALRIHPEVPTELDESFALHNLGHVYHECRRFDEALPLLQRALALRRAVGNRNGEGVTLHCVGDTMLGLGRHGDADAVLRQALAIFVEVGDRYGRAAALHSLGRLRQAQRQPGEAVTHLRKAAAMYHELGSRRDESRALAELQLAKDCYGDIADHCGQ